MGARTVKWMWTCSVFLICLSLALTPGSANALSSAKSIAVIDWGSLKIVTEGLTIDYHDDTFVSRSKAKVWSTNPDAEDKDKMKVKTWKDGDTKAGAAIDGATARAYTSNEKLYESVAAVATGPDSESYAEAWADRWVYFNVKGDGIITLTADYTMYQDIDVDTVDDWAYADSEVWLELYNKNTDKLKYDWRWIERDVWGVVDETNKDEGTLEISLKYHDGDYGYMWIGVYNEVDVYKALTAPVPEPATMLLLGSGLVCLAGFRRKLKSN